ncbi:Methyltransferase type 12, partial [mine drainage metagenome]
MPDVMDQLKEIARWKAELVLTAAEPYRSAGRFAWHFARGKLGGDPVFFGLLRHGLIPSNSRILDL